MPRDQFNNRLSTAMTVRRASYCDFVSGASAILFGRTWAIRQLIPLLWDSPLGRDLDFSSSQAWCFLTAPLAGAIVVRRKFSFFGT